MGKFTNSNLFTQNNKVEVPSWMSDLADNLEINEKREAINWDVERKGVFAENQQVNRTDVIASPRSMNTKYSEIKLITESKINLSKFLSGKYYKVVKANPGVDYITLDVKIDSIASDFKFHYILYSLNEDLRLHQVC